MQGEMEIKLVAQQTTWNEEQREKQMEKNET